MTRRNRLATLLFCLLPAIATAEIYKWTDEQGQVHYGQYPPAGQQAEMIKGPPRVDSEGARNALQERQDGLNEISERRAEEKKKAAEEKQAAQARKERCNAARQALEQLRTQNRMQYINEHGERAFMTEEQRQARFDEARQAVEESCE